MGPHPAVAAVRQAVRDALIGVDGPVLIACSGGADSLALAAATAFEAPRSDVAAGLITVDHGLQPDSATQARRVAAIGYELGLDPVLLVPVTVGLDGGPEGAARTARYASFAATGVTILLGHTLDDQAETVLLGLGRGSGPRSLAGMRPVHGRYRRPLLGLRRATTQAACAALGLESWDDPHNADPRYQRVRLRREALPLLEEILHGGVAEALARTAALTQADLDVLDELAADVYDSVIISAVAAEGGGSPRDDHRVMGEVDARGLAAQPAAIRTRVLRRWAHELGAAPLTSAHLAALDVLVSDWHGQADVQLPGGYCATRASGRLTMHPSPEE